MKITGFLLKMSYELLEIAQSGAIFRVRMAIRTAFILGFIAGHKKVTGNQSLIHKRLIKKYLLSST
jgi:hypothetical protein